MLGIDTLIANILVSIIIGHFSGPGSATGPLCLCVCMKITKI